MITIEPLAEESVSAESESGMKSGMSGMDGEPASSPTASAGGVRSALAEEAAFPSVVARERGPLARHGSTRA